MSRTAIALALGIAALAAACTGPDGSVHSSTGLPADAASPATPRAVVAPDGTSSAPADPVAVAPSTVTVDVSVSHCGLGWTAGRAGRNRFSVHNTDTRPAEVSLVLVATGAVVAIVEPLGPGTTAGMDVDLRAGTYAFRCAIEDADVITGPRILVAGRGGPGTPAVVPVTQQDLIGPTKAYEGYVSGRLPALAAAVTRIRADLGRDDLAAARTDWLAAHLVYEQLGAAYGAFGDADTAINGLPNGLPKGTKDSQFTGFHRLEVGLWHGEPARALVPVTDQLITAVRDLQHTFRTAQIDPVDVAIRAHEITENTVQFELTGQSDFGSGSTLATVSANLTGTAVVLDLLRPLLERRYPGLHRTYAALSRARSDVRKSQTSTGWLTLAQLSRRQRQLLDADLSELTELLAPVALICEPRRT